ncbi:MAG: hypothetical protein HND47_07570 [Chloroflexi bacterium]|nr:hypothetical protein [Chloroflexota bacterium]
MKRPEFLARLLVIAGIFLAIGAPIYFWNRTPLIHARMAEDGGWSPDVIRAAVNEPLHLKLTSDDVVHGFAVGQTDMPGVEILPGKVSEVTLTFDKPGIYTFYCTRWCGLNHWRMRGTIEVTGASDSPEPAAVPLYVSLSLDIDAPHNAPVIPEQKPSALRGREFTANSPFLQSSDYYFTHSPLPSLH